MIKNDIRNLQLKMLEMIKYIDELCRKNNIEYYIIFGSALGAIRHKGFIPWDDDFDIGMTYENYLKFIKVCDKQLDKAKYFLQNKDSEKEYYLSFMKLRDITTTLIEEGNKNRNITYGVYIDIFPFVGIPKNKIKRKFIEINRAFVMSADINVINNKFLSIMFQILKKILGRDKILDICTKNCIKYTCTECDDWCCIFDGDGMKINMTTKQIMGKPKYVNFEDTKLPVPEHTDEYLRHIYGNFMRIPSKEEIDKKQHTRFVLDLNHSYKEYLKIKGD